MAQPEERQRQCERFVIFGATLRYRKEGVLLASHEFSDDVYPILDLSLGGLRFVSPHTIKPDTRIVLELLDPDGKTLVTLKGAVMWSGINPGKSYPYQIGVQFMPYGWKKGYNPPERLEKLIDLENRFGSNSR